MRIRQNGLDRTRFGTAKQGLGLCLAGVVFGVATLWTRSADPGHLMLAFAVLLLLGGVVSLLRLLVPRRPDVGTVGLPATFVVGGSIPTGRHGTTTAHQGFTVTTGPRPVRTIPYPRLQLRVEPGQATVSLRSWPHSWMHRLFLPPLPSRFEIATTKVVPVTSTELSSGVGLQVTGSWSALLQVARRPEVLAALAQAGFQVQPEVHTLMMPTLDWSPLP